MRNVSHKICRENQNKHFKFTNFFLKKYYSFLDNVAKYGRAGQATVTIRRMRNACWTPKSTNTHSGHLIIPAFTQQQWLRESASVLRYTNFACLITNWVVIGRLLLLIRFRHGLT